MNLNDLQEALDCSYESDSGINCSDLKHAAVLIKAARAHFYYKQEIEPIIKYLIKKEKEDLQKTPIYEVTVFNKTFTISTKEP